LIPIRLVAVGQREELSVVQMTIEQRVRSNVRWDSWQLTLVKKLTQLAWPRDS